MKVSVVIPVYNAVAHLDVALESVFAQSGVTTEIFVVDDGSTDGTAESLDRWAAREPGLRVVHQANAGQGAARNRGMELATGDYVYFMDADDELAEPDALARLVAEMERDRLDLLFFDAETRIDSDVRVDERMVCPDYYRRTHGYGGVRTGRDLYVRMMRSGDFCVSPPLMMICRAFLIASGVRFPAAPIYYEDNIWATRLILAAERTSHRAWSLYVRKVHAGSTVTSRPTLRHLRGYLACWRDAERLLAEKDWTASVRRTLRDRVGVYRHYARRLLRENPELLADEELKPGEQEQVDDLWRYPISEKMATFRRCLRDRGGVYTLRRAISYFVLMVRRY